MEIVIGIVCVLFFIWLLRFVWTLSKLIFKLLLGVGIVATVIAGVLFFFNSSLP
ncbi:MAG: hypothetical protein U9O87_03350 [Verrucomicrobiota bacterium]|nr:hypothetical protein [Verrucomicrobiota bacterium]